MRHIHCKLLLAFAFLAFALPAFGAERGVKRETSDTAGRHALVIGNSDYEAVGKLANPVNDADAMERSLKSLGFEVIALKNAGQREMERAITKFGRKLRKGGIGIFFYAGHGIQAGGENYMLPVDANPTVEDDLRYEAVALGRLLNQMADAQNGMNLVILDACRNNPFKRSFRSASKGLAQVTAPTGTFISYATAPGSVAADGTGKNGLYTSKLIANMNTPGLSIESVFKRVRSDVQKESNGKQVPWDSSSLVGDFYFVPPDEKPEPATVATLTPTPAPESRPPVTPSEFRADEEAWKDIKNSSDLDDFRFFLEEFPASPLAKTAKFKLRRLERKQAKAKVEQQQIAEEAKRLEEERKRLAAEKRQLAEAKRKAKAERKRQEELAAISQKKEKHSGANDSLSGSRITPEKIKDDYLAAGAKNTIQGYRLFVQRYENIPQAEFWVSLARKSIKGLQKRLSEPEPKQAKTQRIKQTYDKAVKEDTTEAYVKFLQQFEDDPAARFRVRLAIKKLKNLGAKNVNEEIKIQGSKHHFDGPYLVILSREDRNTKQKQYVGKALMIVKDSKIRVKKISDAELLSGDVELWKTLQGSVSGEGIISATMTLDYLFGWFKNETFPLILRGDMNLRSMTSRKHDYNLYYELVFQED